MGFDHQVVPICQLDSYSSGEESALLMHQAVNSVRGFESCTIRVEYNYYNSSVSGTAVDNSYRKLEVISYTITIGCVAFVLQIHIYTFLRAEGLSFKLIITPSLA